MPVHKWRKLEHDRDTTLVCLKYYWLGGRREYCPPGAVIKLRYLSVVHALCILRLRSSVQRRSEKYDQMPAVHIISLSISRAHADTDTLT